MGEGVLMTILLVIDAKAKTCLRYSGHTLTHGFSVESEITAEKVKAKLIAPDQTGEPTEPEAA